MPKSKTHTYGITERFLLLMNEVIGSGQAENRTSFAKTVGEYQQNLSAMERGDRAPTLEQAATACEAYEYSANWLLLNVGPKKLDPKEILPIEKRVSDLESEMRKLKQLLSKSK